MELTVSGNSLRTLHRSITSLARIGTEVVLDLTPSSLALHTLNSSRSAYLSHSFTPDFFDAFPSPSPTRCSVLLKSVCSVFRTPVAALDRLSLLLPSDSSLSPSLHFSLHCLNGSRKTYRISCNSEPDLHRLSLDRSRFPSNLLVRPRDLARLLSNFQHSLHEITVIATEVARDSAPDGGVGGKAVELRSYNDPTKDDSEAALHTQLWIDPAEEFVQYVHSRNPVDVTFGVKELKAFLSFCEGCEVDIHLFFDKAGEPILLAPRFGLDDGSTSNFDATLVLATMLASQLNEGTTTDHQPAAQVPPNEDVQGMGSQSQRARVAVPSVSVHPSDHTKIWSELSGSVARGSDGTGERDVQMEGNLNSNVHNDTQRPNTMNAAKKMPGNKDAPHIGQPMETDNLNEAKDGEQVNNNAYSQHHPSNWVGSDDEDEEDEEDLYVQSTPRYDEH